MPSTNMTLTSGFAQLKNLKKRKAKTAAYTIADVICLLRRTSPLVEGGSTNSIFAEQG